MNYFLAVDVVTPEVNPFNPFECRQRFGDWLDSLVYKRTTESAYDASFQFINATFPRWRDLDSGPDWSR